MQIVTRLVEDMQDLIHHLTALLLAVSLVRFALSSTLDLQKTQQADLQQPRGPVILSLVVIHYQAL